MHSCGQRKTSSLCMALLACSAQHASRKSPADAHAACDRRWDDASVSPVLRQTLLHWAYELTEADFEQMRKKV